MVQHKSIKQSTPRNLRVTTISTGQDVLQEHLLNRTHERDEADDGFALDESYEDLLGVSTFSDIGGRD